ncbi:MAG: hypothetical protein A2293_01585 [Elusimicrobia bacterium RIFOXYB2_FULL_49_7]|nr:MAG: hypothetical protein A2293_01585 [Elusimicrobia bacterium RIFOXYB2_FULL_49_7]
MRKSLVIASLLITAMVTSVKVEGFDMGQSLMEIGKDAAQGYLSPAVTVFGTGMNAGWYNSSKSLTMFKLPIGISVFSMSEAFANIDEDMQTFTFNGKLPTAPIMDPVVANANLPGISTWQQLVDANPSLPKEIPFSADGVPTVFGSDEPRKLTVAELFAADPAAATLLFTTIGLPNDTVSLPFVGMDYTGLSPSLPAVTAFTIGVKAIPVIDNMQLGVRWFPEMKLGDVGKIGQFGFKIQHEFTRFVPVVKDLPFLHTSAYWAMNSLNIDAGSASLEQSNWVIMANASADAKFFIGLGAFIGLGFESSSMTLDVDMTEAGLDNYSLTIDGDNGFRFQTGLRLSLLNFDIYADANFGAVTSYNTGITLIGLNGL